MHYAKNIHYKLNDMHKIHFFIKKSLAFLVFCDKLIKRILQHRDHCTNNPKVMFRPMGFVVCVVPVEIIRQPEKNFKRVWCIYGNNSYDTAINQRIAYSYPG